MILPKVSEGQFGLICHLKALLEHTLGVQFLKICDNLLVHGLDDRSGIERAKTSP